MALTIALPLSGLEAEHFYSIGARLLYEQGLKSLGNSGLNSPSTGSESSGVGSLGPSVELSTPLISPTSSRSHTPSSETRKSPEKVCKPVKVLYKGRDILNLGANIREPSWQMRNPTIPRYNFKTFMENRSIYHRLSENGLVEEYPMINCNDCGFEEPSPELHS